MANDAQDFFYTQYRKLGNVFRVRAFGQEFKVLAGPEINILMATQMDAFTAWDIWAPVISDFGGRKTLTMNDLKFLRASIAGMIRYYKTGGWYD